MQLFARKSEGDMVPFQVDDDFPYKDKNFYLTPRGGYIFMRMDQKSYLVSRIVLGLQPGDKRQAHHVDEDIYNIEGVI